MTYQLDGIKDLDLTSLEGQKTVVNISKRTSRGMDKK